VTVPTVPTPCPERAPGTGENDRAHRAPGFTRTPGTGHGLSGHITDAERAPVFRLADNQLEHLADMVAERLRVQVVCARKDSSGLVDAATLARALGMSRSLVYARASELGGRRIGGDRGRLRFDIGEARAALRRLPAKAEDNES